MFDPLIRLRLDELQGLQHQHRYSELDPQQSMLRLPPLGLLSGSTEWASEGRMPVLSFSWDWDYDRQAQRLEAHWHSLRTNLRVLDADGGDPGFAGTRMFLSRLLTNAHWERVVAHSLDLPLSMPVDARH
jgi:hypothetical protein